MDRGSLSLVAATICWGVAVPLSKLLLDAIEPIPLLAIQLGGSVLLIGATMLARHEQFRLPTGHSLAVVAAIGCLEPGLAYGLDFIGLQYTTALHSSIILALEPLGILFINVLLFKFRRDSLLTVFAAVAFTGVVIIALSGSDGSGSAQSLYGDALVFAGTMTAALYVSLSTQYLKCESVLSMLLVQQTCSFLLTVCIFGVQWALNEGSDTRLSSETFAAAAVVGVLQFALAFLFYFEGVKRARGYYSVVILNLTPVIAVAASVLLLRERIHPAFLLGAAMTVAAAILSNMRERKLEPVERVAAPARDAVLRDRQGV